MTRSERAAKAVYHLVAEIEQRKSQGDRFGPATYTERIASTIRREIPGCDSKPDDWTQEDMYSVAYKRAQAITHGTDVKLTVNELDRLFAILKCNGDGP